MVFAFPFNTTARAQGWRRHLPPAKAAVLFTFLAASPQTTHAKEKGDTDESGKTGKAKKEASTETPRSEDGESFESEKADAPLITAGATENDALDEGTMKPTIMFFDVGFRSDTSLLYTRTTVGRFQEQEDFDLKSFGSMMHVGIMTNVFWKLRLGAALGYGFNYTMTERLTDFEEEENVEPETWTLGQIYTGDIRLEFSQELMPKLWVLVTPRGGLQAVLPGEHLLRESESYEGAYNVRKGPQLGIIGGFEIGARYLFLDWFAVRIAGGYDYYTQGLLKAKRKSDSVSYTALWRMSGARVGGNLGIEAVF